MMQGNDHFEKPDPPEDADSKVDATELMLVAYLDGEMTEDERRAFDARLQSEPALRRRLEQLRQAWDLLDELEACPPSTRFAETTLEMVALDAEAHLHQEKEKQRHAFHQRRNRIGLGLLAALVTGFLLIYFLYPSPDEMLIKHLPLIARLDDYEAAESVALLEAFDQAKLFPPASASKAPSETTARPDRQDSDSGPSSVPAEEGTLLEQAPPIPDSAKLRRQWIKDLEPIQRAQLAQYQERFEQLPPERRQKLVDLQRDLADAEQSTRLTDIMHQYSEWLRHQLSFTRTNLLNLDASDRIAKIQSLRREELDREGLRKWFHKKWQERLAEMQRSSNANREPRDQRSPEPGPPAPDAGRPGNWGPLIRPELAQKKLSREDLDELKQYLSPETAKIWDAKSLSAKRSWIRMMFHRMMLENSLQRRISAKANNVSDEDLADFFENRLNEKQKTELLNTSGEQLHQNLLELYLRSSPMHRPNDRMPNDLRRGRGPGHGRGFGPGAGRFRDGLPSDPPQNPMPSDLQAPMEQKKPAD